MKRFLNICRNIFKLFIFFCICYPILICLSLLFTIPSIFSAKEDRFDICKCLLWDCPNDMFKFMKW